ncbi:MAG: 50S ribosomal protein L25 [Dehalococcoidia bacterium]|nr:50S ribosomal protein L25 [Dehalococcoidia bacterium]
MPDTYAVEPRTVTGKRVKRMRSAGVVPANIYGRGVESVAVQIPFVDARTMINAHGRNSLIEVQVTGEAKARPVVVRQLDIHPLNGALRHIDFYQVDLQRTISAEIPVVLTGESPVVTIQGGILMHGAEAVLVEALPAELPEQLEISVESLTEFDQQLSAGQLQLPQGVTLLSGEDLMLARISRPRIEEEPEAVLEGEEAEAAEEGEPAEKAAEDAEETEGASEDGGED